MTEPLYRLVYYSRNTMPREAGVLAGAVAQILRYSERNNAQAGVTGALMFNAGCFGQVLEGPRRAVEATFERIQRDPRHSDVSLLAFEPTPERQFPNWSMGFVGARADDAEQFGSIGEASGFDPSRMDADTLFDTLRRLALEEEEDGPI